MVADQRLTLHSSHLQKTYSTFSNNSGEFLFAKVAASDDYRLTVQSNGTYQDYRQDDLLITAAGFKRAQHHVTVDASPIEVRLIGELLD